MSAIRLRCFGRPFYDGGNHLVEYGPHESANNHIMLQLEANTGARQRSEFFLCKHCGCLFLGFSEEHTLSAEGDRACDVVPGVSAQLVTGPLRQPETPS
jgi:hypothetical protein